MSKTNVKFYSASFSTDPKIFIYLYLHVLPVYAALTLCPKHQRGSAQEDLIPELTPLGLQHG